MRKGLAFLYYFFSFAGNASLFPFMVLFYQHLGLSGAQIGILTGIGPLISLFGTPFWTGLGDVSRRHRLLMNLAMISLVLLTPLFTFAHTFVQVLLLVIYVSIASAPIGAFADSATLALLGDDKAQYGRIRLGGTLGWAVMAPLAGILVQRFGLEVVFWSFACLAFLSFVSSQGFIFSQGTGPSIELRGGLRILLSSPRWVLFMMMALVSGMGIMSINNYLYSYLKEINIVGGWMGVASMLATIFEVPVFFFGNRLLKRFKPYTLLIMGVAILGARLVLYNLIYFPVGVMVLQLLNGLAFPIIWVAGVSYADACSPVGLKATSQGLFGGMVFGFGSALGGLISGPLLASLGGRGLFLVMGLIVLTSLVVIASLERRLAVEAIA